MARLLDRLFARFAAAHADRAYRAFVAAIADVDAAQLAVLRRLLPLVRDGAYARQYDLRRVRTPAELRAALPLVTYDDLRPFVERVAEGDARALYSRNVPPLMFATSSGTTSRPKLVPVPREFAADYRRGWNTFGLKLLTDHPEAILRDILQVSGRYDAARSAVGIPIGAITGLMARFQKRLVRRYYVGRPEIAEIDDPHARHYTLMRLGVTRDVAWAVTANPATLIQMARVASEESETLLRDIHDGTLSTRFVARNALRTRLAAGLRPDPPRARALSALRGQHGALRPRDYWRLAFIACWTGGSMGHYLERLAYWWGPVPVRDIGLLASEGRVSVPLRDNEPIGALDVTSAVFEFIPADIADAPQPVTLGPRDLQVGREYAVVLSNTTGLLRYRLGDVVRVHGYAGETPLVEFRYRAGRVASVAGEKLTEQQAVEAVRAACRKLGISPFDFVLAPVWNDPPYYRLSCAAVAPHELAAAVDTCLGDVNEEYASRRNSSRLGRLQIRLIAASLFRDMDRRLCTQRGSTAEQYKRPCLFLNPGDDDRALQPGNGTGV